MAEDKKQEQAAAQEDPKPSYMTAEDYNKAATAREARLSKSIEKMVGDRLAAILAEREAQAEEARQEKAQAQPSAAERELEKMRKRLDASEKARADEAAQLQREKAERADKERREALAGALRRAGVADEDYVSTAQHLHLGKVMHDDKGSIVYRSLDKAGVEVDRSLEDAIKEWAGSAQGKKFVAPSGAQGSGARPTRQAPAQRSSVNEDKTAALAALLRAHGRGE